MKASDLKMIQICLIQEKKSCNLLAFGEEKFNALISKYKMADEARPMCQI
jgi:hypothetical protein